MRKLLKLEMSVFDWGGGLIQLNTVIMIRCLAVKGKEEKIARNN